MKKSKKDKKKSGKGSGIMREMDISETLQKVVKQDKMSRGQVMKAIWKYIKKHSLQDDTNKRLVHCDEKLAPIFKKLLGKKRTIEMRGKKIKIPKDCVFMTEFGKALSKHIG